jgi:hypothetical protein
MKLTGMAGSEASEGITWNKVIGRSEALCTEDVNTERKTWPKPRPLTEGTVGFAGMLLIASNLEKEYTTPVACYTKWRTTR